MFVHHDWRWHYKYSIQASTRRKTLNVKIIDKQVQTYMHITSRWHFFDISNKKRLNNRRLSFFLLFFGLSCWVKEALFMNSRSMTSRIANQSVNYFVCNLDRVLATCQCHRRRLCQLTADCKTTANEKGLHLKGSQWLARSFVFRLAKGQLPWQSKKGAMGDTVVQRGF